MTPDFLSMSEVDRMRWDNAGHAAQPIVPPPALDEAGQHAAAILRDQRVEDLRRELADAVLDRDFPIRWDVSPAGLERVNRMRRQAGDFVRARLEEQYPDRGDPWEGAEVCEWATT